MGRTLPLGDGGGQQDAMRRKDGAASSRSVRSVRLLLSAVPTSRDRRKCLARGARSPGFCRPLPDGCPLLANSRAKSNCRLSRPAAAAQVQSSTTLPESPDFIAMNPSRNSSTVKRWVITRRTSSPFSSMAIILYQVSKISRP